MCNLDTAVSGQLVDVSQEPIPDLVPRDAISQAAYRHAREHLHQAILAHSLRVFFYARELSRRESAIWHSGDRLPLLFTACIFHDFGACALHDDGQYRFEVEGADAAISFLQAHGVTEHEDTHDVWVAIACHTSPHVGERISTLARIMRQAALSDFHRLSDVRVVDQRLDNTKQLFVIKKEVEQIERQFPRDGIEKLLSDSVVAQAQREGGRRKAPGGSWPGDLLKAAEEDPQWTGVNKAF